MFSFSSRAVIALISILLCQQIQADQVTIVESVDKTACTYVGQDICTTEKKKKTHEKCHSWHRDKARASGANAVLITDESSSERRRPSFDGSSKVIKTTKITASYFDCPEDVFSKNALNKNSPAAASKPSENTDSIEQRLLRLESLYKKGLVTEAEYKSKRKEILSDL